MFIETGASGRNPFRQMFTSQEETIQDFNKYKRYSNVYHSIYWFREKEEKFYKDGNFKRWGPDYNTAIITRISLDLDSFEKIKFNGQAIETYSDSGIESIRRFADWCKANDYTREYIFSGGGFYGIVKAEGHPLKLRDGMMKLGLEANLHIDPATVGDTSRMMRVLNSFNFGEHRKCYCIPLREEELSLSYSKIHTLAERPRFRQKFIYGNGTFSLSNFKIDKAKIKKKSLFVKIKQDSNVDEILSKYGWTMDEICEPIKHIISKSYVGHYERYELIKYFKSVIKVSYEDCVNLIAILLKEAGMHSLVEGQAQYAYTRDRVFNPKKFKAIGLCPINCHKCQRLINVI